MITIEEAKVEIKALLEERTTFHIGYVELENFLSKIFGRTIQILEIINDTTREASVLDMPDEDDIKEIDYMLKNYGTFEYWRIHQVFEWLVYNGYLNKGDYFVDFWW